MPLLNENIQKQIRQTFEDLDNPVKLLLFTQEDGPATLECAMCGDTRKLAEEVAALSDRIELEVYDFVKDQEVAQRYQVDKIPAMVILGGPDFKDNGIRIYGIPSGYEFGTLIEDLIMVSRGKTDLSDKTMKEVGKLNQPVHIQVYTTPT